MTNFERLLAPLLKAWTNANKRLGLLRLNAAAIADPERLGTGTPDATNFLRGDSCWCPGGTGGLGDVVGPASAIDNNIATFDLTTGKLIQDSGITLSGTGSLAVSGTTSVSGTNTGDQAPGGSSTHVQYNDGGAFGGEAAFAYDKTANILTVPDLVASGDVQIDGGLSVDLNTTLGAAVTAVGPIDVAGGTNSAPGYTFTGDLNLGIFRNAADDMQFTAGGTAIAKVSTGGFSILALGGSRHVLRQASAGANVTSSALAAGDFGSNVVPIAALATIATDRLLGRDTAGTGGVETLTVGGGVEFSGSTGIQRSALTGDVTASAGSNTTAIAAGVIVNADVNSGAAIDLSKLATQAANTVVANPTSSSAVPSVVALSASQLLGRGSTGDVAAITLGTNLSMSGATLNAAGGGGSPGGSDTQVQFNDGGAFGGDSGLVFNKTTDELTVGGKVLIADGSASAPSLAIASNTGTGIYKLTTDIFGICTGGSARIGVGNSGVFLVGTGGTGHLMKQGSASGYISSAQLAIGDVPDGLLTLAKLANLATDRLMGRDTAGTGVPEALTVGGGVEFTGSGGIQRSALTGDVTASAGSGSTTIANDAVTYAKLQNAAAGNVVLARAAATSGDYSEVALSASQLFGRGATGDVAPIALGTNLSMSGTTLNAAGGSGSPGGSNKELQYNNSSSFGGISSLTYESGTPGLYFGGLEARWQASGLDTHPWLKVNAAGSTKEIQLGSGSSGTLDVNLYRGGADILTTDDQFVAVGGVVLPTKSGTFADGDFTNPVDGLIGVNTSTNKLNYRSGGAWYST